MPKLTVVEAINLALKQEMEKDPRALVLGEDVGKDGGVFRATQGLLELFGENRVIDTPLSESAIVGTSIGLAVYGLRPVAEIQFEGFVYGAMEQLVAHAARIRTRSRGRYECPIVIRVPYGGGIHAPEHHSESNEAYFVHTPGLKVVVPSTPYEAKGLLLSAIRDPDPVVYMEPKRIYRSIREEVPEEEYLIPLGRSRVVIEGNNVTLIAWGAMLQVALQGAKLMADRGIRSAYALASRRHCDYRVREKNQQSRYRPRGAAKLRRRSRSHSPHQREGLVVPGSPGGKGDRI